MSNEKQLLTEFIQWLRVAQVPKYSEETIDLFLRVRKSKNTKSICPYCNGNKIKVFMSTHISQQCQECDQDGMIENSKLVTLGLEEFITKK